MTIEPCFRVVNEDSMAPKSTHVAHQTMDDATVAGLHDSNEQKLAMRRALALQCKVRAESKVRARLRLRLWVRVRVWLRVSNRSNLKISLGLGARVQIRASSRDMVRRTNADAGPAEPEGEGQATACQRWRARRRVEAARDRVLQQQAAVVRGRDADEHACGAGSYRKAAQSLSGVLSAAGSETACKCRFRDALQQEPLLGVDERRLRRGESEDRRIKSAQIREVGSEARRHTYAAKGGSADLRLDVPMLQGDQSNGICVSDAVKGWLTALCSSTADERGDCHHRRRAAAMELSPHSSGWGGGCCAGLVQRSDVLRQGRDGRAVDDHGRWQPDTEVGLHRTQVVMLHDRQPVCCI